MKPSLSPSSNCTTTFDPTPTTPGSRSAGLRGPNDGNLLDLRNATAEGGHVTVYILEQIPANLQYGLSPYVHSILTCAVSQLPASAVFANLCVSSIFFCHWHDLPPSPCNLSSPRSILVGVYPSTILKPAGDLSLSCSKAHPDARVRRASPTRRGAIAQRGVPAPAGCFATVRSERLRLGESRSS